ncbi:HAMP domain-containing sensor histidine kinase [Streptococcus moroccensis]|uniref:Heme sensor protein HssS n=1 Tax=Streptococcus moroccensis TaxID=1451356 RepID=A0ABT9YT00_9STRE|nr:HAMP domain-containing sensor histidine kinase [Streptococcus moroccensis]MDQ0222260.1 signal transduction histidine kinase [Streptococcus moroccensis]
MKRFLNDHPFLVWQVKRYFAIVAITQLTIGLIFWGFSQIGYLGWNVFLNIIGVSTPFLAIIFIVITYSTYKTERHIKSLTDAISEVANGDFSQKIPLEKKSPFNKVYLDFNKMTQDLSHVQSLRDDFINEFSHEFKTPITSIQGFAKLLKKEDISPEKKDQYLSVIEKEASRLATLSTNIMILTALEGQEILTNKLVFDLSESIRQAAILALPAIEEKGITLDIDLPELVYKGDATLLSHVWNNLLSNAIKFVEPGGHIWIDGYQDGQEIIVSFTNDGPFIPKEKQAYLYDKFYQEETPQKQDGLGLGLAITKKVLSLTNGSISLVSDPEHLTRFTVTL